MSRRSPLAALPLLAIACAAGCDKSEPPAADEPGDPAEAKEPVAKKSEAEPLPWIEVRLAPDQTVVTGPGGEETEVREPGQVGDALAARDLDPAKTQVFFTGAGVDCQALVDAMDAATRAGFEELSLGERRSDEEEGPPGEPPPTEEWIVLAVTPEEVQIGDWSADLASLASRREELEEALRDALRSAPRDTPLVFQADRRTRIEDLLLIEESAGEAGFRDIRLAVNRKP